MKIAIVTAYYEPIPAPRAFRAAELAREFVRRGYEVSVFNTTSVIRDGVNVSRATGGVKLVNLDIIRMQQDSPKAGNRTKEKWYKSEFRKYLFYFTTNTWLKILFGLKRKLVFNEQFDLLISIGLPFTVHWGVSSKIKDRQVARCYVADYGDPFSRFNHSIKVAKYFQWIEKRVLRRFDYVTVPTSRAVSSYLWLKEEKSIKVIPQGFNFDDIRLAEYQRNPIPTFGYAGLFYSDIRNPKNLFEFLCSLDFDFRFVIYTNLSSADSYSCLEPYVRKLGAKLELRHSIPRLDLIYCLSSMDFIVNVNNASENQIPSKLVDYKLSGRPIFSLSQNNFDSQKFVRFCAHEFTGEEKIDISGFDIRNVASQFEELVK